MKRATITGGAFATALVLLVVAANHWALEQDVDARAVTSPAITLSTESTEEASQGFLYGLVTTDDGTTYQGRLRFGGDEEAFWGNYFMASKARTRGPRTRRSSGCIARSRSSGSRSPSGNGRKTSAGR